MLRLTGGYSELYRPFEARGETIRHRLTFTEDSLIERSSFCHDLLAGVFCELLHAVIHERYVILGPYR